MSNQIVTTGISFFGADTLKNFNEEIKNSGFQRIFIIAAPEFQSALKKISSMLAKNKIVYSIFDRVSQVASLSDTRAALNAAKTLRADAVISVGSKSVSDIAKAVSILLSNPEISDPRKLERKAKSKNKAIPLYMFFTSIGSPWDSSHVFILEDESQRKKIECADTNAIPKAFFFDTELASVANKNNFSVLATSLLASSIESFICKSSWDLSDFFALKAIKLISENALSASKGNSKAIENMLYAQYCAGIAFSNGGAAFATAASLSVEAAVGISFSKSIIPIFKESMEFNAASTGQKYKAIAVNMGAKVSSSASPESFRKTAVTSVEKFFKELSAAKKVEEVKISKEDVLFIQENILKSKYTELNPKTVTKKKIADVLKLIF
ncbi:iron-containing alcohol dehydrogenase [uncultured Treponema sp.]|uniref:iron-containing alcohol dehydrogenase n=1 Tax=uncultured Treponema sp. TaxID=162155 RepID=UPI00258E8D00|nr:iron-containing alcohol dehydrogenase [uncultured Treponema sp.]